MKAHGFKLCCCCFLLPLGVCINVNFILAYMTIGSYLYVSCYYIMHLQLFTRKDTVTKEMLVIDEPVHVAVGLQLLEMSSITTLKTKQFRMFAQGTFFKEFFLYPLQTLFVVGILFSCCPCVCATVRPSVTFCFFNNLKSHCWIFIKPCKHAYICKTNTLDKKVRARCQFY